MLDAQFAAGKRDQIDGANSVNGELLLGILVADVPYSRYGCFVFEQKSPQVLIFYVFGNAA
jgi:hypothetical protein